MFVSLVSNTAVLWIESLYKILQGTHRIQPTALTPQLLCPFIMTENHGDSYNIFNMYLIFTSLNYLYTNLGDGCIDKQRKTESISVSFKFSLLNFCMK